MTTDIVFPNGNEKEFIEMAERLGIGELVFAYSKLPNTLPNSSPNVKVSVTILAEPKNVQAIKRKAEFVICRASATEQDRFIFEKAKPDIIFDLEQSHRQDGIFQRNSGLNHIMAALAAKNSITIGFSFASILNSSGFRRAQILGRMAQNLFLCRKYKVKTLFASFARSPWEMRSGYDLNALFGLLS